MLMFDEVAFESFYHLVSKSYLKIYSKYTGGNTTLPSQFLEKIQQDLLNGANTSKSLEDSS